MLRPPVDMSKRKDINYTLRNAISNDRLDRVQSIHHGAKDKEALINHSVMSERGDNPLLWCARNNNVKIAAWLIKHGARYPVYNDKGEDMVHRAAEHNAMDFLLFLQRGAYKFTHVTPTGATALITAAFANNQKGSDYTFDFLCRAGIDPNHRHESGETALTIVIFQQNNEAIAPLLCAGADPYLPNPNPKAKGLTPIDMAYHCQGEELAQYLITTHAQIIELAQCHGAKHEH